MSFLDPETWRAASPLLDVALDLDDDERAVWLEALRTDRPDIAPAVAMLLDDHRLASSRRFLEDSPALSPEPLVGAAVGGYRLVAPLGHGGMGSVWLAERSDGRFEGRAAVKFLNAGLVGHVVQERFTREGSILARLSHPQIAHLIDAGVTAIGQPYLVLEYVDGEPIDRYCARQRLDAGSRVRLFLDVLAPVAHAHANLVVHRDLKPLNVLVTRAGGVKLLDFGIAKLLGEAGALAPATQITNAGGGALTPAYAAPEQVTGGAVTTATDVYALGVLLYELLSGRHPFADAARSPAALLHAIVNDDPPPLTAEGKVPHALAGDLRVIVSKAMKKNAAERYGSVSAFADDLRRCLADEPISARADAWSYRTTKFVRRHRAGVAMTALAVAALVAGLAGTITQARRATAQAAIAAGDRDFAMRQLARAEALNDLNGFLLTEAAPAGTSFTVNELLAQAEDVVSRQVGQSDEVRVELMVAIGRQYWAQDEPERAREILEAAYTLSAPFVDPAPRAKAGCALASTLAALGDGDRAEALVAASLAQLSDDPRYRLTSVFCELRGAEVARGTGRSELAVRRVEAAARLLPDGEPVSPLLRLRLSLDMAESYRDAVRNQDADAAFRQAATQLTALGYDRTETAETLFNNWGLTLRQMGRPRDAEVLFRRAIAISSADGTDARVSPFVLNNLARTLEDLERFPEALEYATRAYEKGLAAGNQVAVLQSLLARAMNYRNVRNLARADAMLDEAEPLAAKMLPRGHLAFASIVGERAGLAANRGDLTAALALFDEAVDIAAPVDGQYGLPRLLLRRAALALEMRDLEGVRADAERALGIFSEVNGADAHSGDTGRAHLMLGRALLGLGRSADAQRELSSAAKHLDAYGPDHSEVSQVRQLLDDLASAAPTRASQ